MDDYELNTNSKACWVIVEKWQTTNFGDTRWDIIGVYADEENAKQELNNLRSKHTYSKYYIKRCSFYETI